MSRHNELQQMLQAVADRRRRLDEARADDRGEIEAISFADLPPLRPRWRARMERAAEDGVMESLYASIREEGWRAFAEGGLKAMHDLADRACGNDGYLSNMLDHRWDGIGTSKGVWVA